MRKMLWIMVFNFSRLRLPAARTPKKLTGRSSRNHSSLPHMHRKSTGKK